ncbi:unnamed protein product [Agarophyton chilense]
MNYSTVQDAPIIHPTLEEMGNFAELTARASDMAMRHGAVLINPPPEWCPPPMRMRPSSRFFVRTQVLPEAPFVDPEFLRNLSTTSHRETKRRRRPSYNQHEKPSPLQTETQQVSCERSLTSKFAPKIPSPSRKECDRMTCTSFPDERSTDPKTDATHTGYQQKDIKPITNLNSDNVVTAPRIEGIHPVERRSDSKHSVAIANNDDCASRYIPGAEAIEEEVIVEDVEDAGLQKPSIKKPARSSRKRKSIQSNVFVFNQDSEGRLTKPITFSYSETPISLQTFKERAQTNINDLHRKLSLDEKWCSEIVETGNGWRKDIKHLEKIFWHSMRKGLDGKPLCVDYGVDVEAEGAFDTQDMSYAEWYGSLGKQVPTVPQKRANPDPQFVRRPTEDSRLVASRHVGNVNEDSLLRHLPNMPGINHSMYYVGQLFTRFCWHTEDGFLNSISYLHEGSAEKIWYAIPPQHAPKFEEYAAMKMFSPSLVDENVSGQALLMNKTTMFDPKEIARHGIPVYRVTHRPRTIVVTGPRAYHAGFNCGFNIAEAVNFAHPSWFPLGREASKFARRLLKPLCIPWEYLLYHEARSMQASLLPYAREGKLLQRMRTHAAIVARELRRVMIEGEKTISQYAEEKNLRIKMLNDISVVVKNCQVGPEYGPGAGIVCTLCGHACHFYAAVCGCCEGGEEARCPEHFGFSRVCDKKGHNSVLVRRHDPIMLLDLLDDLEEIGGVGASAEDRLKRYKGFLRPWQTPLRKSGLRLRIDLLRAMSCNGPKPKRKKDGATRERKKKSRSRDAKHVHFEADEFAQHVT